MCSWRVLSANRAAVAATAFGAGVLLEEAGSSSVVLRSGGAIGRVRFGPRQIAPVTPGDVQGWIASLTVAGYAPSTIRKACELAAVVFRAAIDSDLLSRSPIRGVRLPQIVSQELRLLTISEVGHLVDKTPKRHRAIVLAAAYTGLRFGELAGLRIDRLDLLGRSLTVDATLSEVRGRVSLNEPKTKAARRQVALPRFLCDRLARHIEVYPQTMPGLSSSERRVRHCVERTSAVGSGSPS